MEFNTDLILNIAIVVCVVGAIAALYFSNKKKKAFEAIAYLVDYAENQFGAGNGEYKYNYVITNIYPMLPSLLKNIVSPSTVDKWIEEAVNNLQDELKKKIESNK